MPTLPPTIDNPPVLPDPSDKDTFSARKLANMKWVNEELTPKANAIGQASHANAQEAIDARDGAVLARNAAGDARDAAVDAAEATGHDRAAVAIDRAATDEARQAAEAAAASVPHNVSTDAPLPGAAAGDAGTSSDVSAADHRHPNPGVGDIAGLAALLSGPSQTVLHRTGGVLTSVDYTQDGKPGTITLIRTGGVLTSVVTVFDGKTRTETLNRTNGVLTSVDVTEE